MGVLDGQPVNQAITNPAFINKNVDDVMPNQLGFDRALSGPSISDIQQAVNNIYDATGVSESTSGTDYNAPAGTIINGDNYQTALYQLAAKFDAATGHVHTGSAGDAPPVSAGIIANVPLLAYFSKIESVTGVTGSSTNVTSFLGGVSPSNAPSVTGVVVNSPNNYVLLQSAATGTLTDNFVDTSGNLVYGRLTYSSPNYTLSYYSLVSGTETAYSFSTSTHLQFFYQLLYNPLQTNPTYNPELYLDSRQTRTVAVTGNSGLFGNILFVPGTGAQLSQSGQNITISATGHVDSIAVTGNAGITGNVVLVAGTGAQLGQSGQNITISATGNVTSIAASGNAGVTGAVVLVAGTGVQLSEAGQNITISATGALGGGGGGSLQWVEGSNSPTPIQEYGNWVYTFDAGLAQQLTTSIKVPSSYSSGSPVNLIMPVYSTDTTGNLLFQTVSTLIRSGTDAMSSTTNQRTSTNSAITLSAGTNNKPQVVTFDLSSSIGQINAVNISSGDLILITFKRGTDTSTVSARAIVFSGETKFS